LEDVFLTGFAAEICQIKRVHSADFHPLPTKKNPEITDIFFHYVDDEKKQSLFENFNNLLTKMSQ